MEALGWTWFSRAEAAIQKPTASNQWNYYQAKSNKQNLAELSVTLTAGEAQANVKQAVERYKTEKEEIKVEAEKLETAAKAADQKSELEMHVHEHWALATTLLQIAIALAAIEQLAALPLEKTAALLGHADTRAHDWRANYACYLERLRTLGLSAYSSDLASCTVAGKPLPQ